MYGDTNMVQFWYYAISQSSELLNCHMWPVNTCYLSSSRVMASFLSCLMGLTFSTILNVQIILDSVACDFFFSSPRKKKDMSQHTKAWVYSIAAESYIIFWVYGFLISRYSSQDDVTDMDSEHISNRFLEDIQYGCQETFDPIIKIDNLIYLELYHEISKVLLGVIRRGMASINDYLKEERNRNKVLQLFSGLLPQLPFCIPSWVEYWVYSSKDGKFHRIQMWCELHYRTDITA